MQKSMQNGKKAKGAIRSVDTIPRIVGPSGNIPLGFPAKLLTRIRYHDTEVLASTTGSIAKYYYRLNSTFDPDVTGAGHQPMFRDTFASIYDHYSVVSTKVTVKFANTSTVSYHTGVLIDDDGSTSTNIDTLCEDTQGQTEMLPPLSGSLSSHTYHVRWDCEKYLGINPFASETYKTATGSNPAEESQLAIWAVPTDGSSSASVVVTVMLEYTVLWTELASPSQS